MSAKKNGKPKVSLSVGDGNAFAIIANCMRAAKNAGWPTDRRDTVRAEMMGAGSYDALLQKAMEYFDVS